MNRGLTIFVMPESKGVASPDQPLAEGILSMHTLSGRDGVNRKRGRSENEMVSKPINRRRIACQQCRSRKVKCDNIRPNCGFCVSATRQCVYVETSGGGEIKDDPTMKTVLKCLGQLMERVEDLTSLVQPHDRKLPGTDPRHMECPDIVDAANGDEMSKDYLRIPSSNTTADSVLTWPIFQARFPPEHLTNILLASSPLEKENSGNDELVVQGDFEPLSDERIPSLIEQFLQNVHTKNPILDVDALIKYGRKAAVDGPGWNASSCLVLLACALGSIALPAEFAIADRDGTNPYAPAVTSSVIYERELRQAESCYYLACRRLGLLKHTVLGAQCYFYSAVYLMYTFRPVEAWNHFCQASTFCQVYFQRIARSSLINPDIHIGTAKVTLRRLEQSLYWSCFKSECEIRVELPLPQSAIANMEYPHMFPSPPSQPANESYKYYEDGTMSLEQAMREYSNKVSTEEKSWYYYLTEVALRRIGNRILNTFYRKDHTTWLDIRPLIPIAKEFEAQILVWSANLPPSMQYEDNGVENYSSSYELSWATWNRLLEMRFWLFQPFLYYAIHQESASVDIQDPDLQSLVDAMMECNAETVRTRTLRHRHHGIWFDIRAITTASFSVIAAAKSGRVEVQPEWEDRIKQVIATLAFWEGESTDLVQSRHVLEEVFAETIDLIRATGR